MEKSAIRLLFAKAVFSDLGVYENRMMDFDLRV